MNPSPPIALVTGASRGIGRAIALALSEEGIPVAVNFHQNEIAAGKLVQDIQKRGRQAQAFQADVSNPQAVQAMIQGIKSAFGGLHILVNNAGITRDNLLLMMKPEEWHDVLATNLNSLYNVTKLAAKEMLRARWGRIINISSISSTRGGRGQTNYAATKGGTNAFTVSLAAELGKKGITVNGIAPGIIETDMSERIRNLAGEKILEEIVLGRYGTPEDVAHVAAFLASEKAGYITGQIIYVDGGFRL